MDDLCSFGTENGESEQGISPVEREESVSVLKVRLENCEKRCQELRVQNDRLHNRTVDLTTQLEQKSEEIRSLQGQLESRQTDVARLQNQLEVETQKFVECKDIAEKLRTKVAELTDEKRISDNEEQMLKEKITKLKEGIETYRKDNENLQNAFESQMKKYGYRIQELEEKSKMLEQELYEKDRALTECRQKMNTWEEEKRQLEKTIENQQGELRVYKGYLEDSKRLLSEVSRRLGTGEPENFFQPEHKEIIPQPDVSSEPKESEKHPWELDDEDVLLEL
jgi:chromosome segregation ATPase